MKKYLVFIAVLLLVNVATWYFLMASSFAPKVFAPDVERLQPVVVDVFIFTLQEEVDKKIGQPMEGYTPAMFMKVFPGLTGTDFAGVDASIGHYTFAEGKLLHQFDDTELVHSAATAITREGMTTLLQNVTKRIEVDLREEGTITDVMSYLVDVQ